MIASHHANSSTVLSPDVVDGTHLLETASVHFCLKKSLDFQEARRLRGAVAAQMDRPEFHQHGESGLFHRSPLIRYDTSDGTARVFGIGNGSLLLRGLPQFDVLRLGSQKCTVFQQTCVPSRSAVGPITQWQEYRFRSPYLPLNQENFNRWKRARSDKRQELLRRVVVGNLLSFAKGIGLTVSTQLQADVALEPGGWFTLKPGVRLLGFTGTIRVNFLLPDGWGLGKSIARGFGTVIREGRDG